MAVIKNEVTRAIEERRSVRAFTGQKLTQDELDTLTFAGLAAPSAMNAQPWRFITVTDPEMIREMELDVTGYYKEINDTAMVERLQSRGDKVFYNASAVIYIPISGSSMSPIDAGIAVENIALAAHSIGLESVIIGMNRVLFMGSKKDYWMKKLNFPEGYVYGISIAVGHTEPGYEKTPHELDYGKASVI